MSTTDTQASSANVDVKEYVGGCFCKKFRYKFRHAPFDNGESPVVHCNCSYCEMKGVLWAVLPEEHLELTAGRLEEFTLFEFKRRAYKHLFCPECGTQIMVRDTRKEPGKIWLELNVRTVDDVDVEKLKLMHFDGKNLL